MAEFSFEKVIKKFEDNAEANEIMAKRYDDSSGYSRSKNEEIRLDEAIICENHAKMLRQSITWLKDYKRLKDLKEPKLVSYKNKGNTADCPNCVHTFDYGEAGWLDANYCPGCGQALKW